MREQTLEAALPAQTLLGCAKAQSVDHRADYLAFRRRATGLYRRSGSTERKATFSKVHVCRS